MKLQSRFLYAFGVLALITLFVALLGIWQVHRLGMALYEIGGVRLPSIQGLTLMGKAMDRLEDSGRALLADGLGSSALRQQLEVQRQAWVDFERGWQLYEPLPQTAEESVLWRDFVPQARIWREDFQGALAAVAAAVAGHDPAQLTAAHERLDAVSRGSFAGTATQLEKLNTLNYQEANEAKRQTVATHTDLDRMRTLMLGSAIASVVSAVGFGLIAGRRLSRPAVEFARAISRVAAGDRQVQVHIDGRADEEMQQMGKALNHMVDSIRVNETRLQRLADNLPDSMIYQLVREPDGMMRFLHASAGIEKLHGVTAEAVRQDAGLFYGQIFEEDLRQMKARTAESLAGMLPFTFTARLRLPDGSIRWRIFRSQPRHEAGGRIIWDGIESDITERMKVELDRERLARVVESHPDAAYWAGKDNRLIYVNDAACRTTGYTREELIGRSLSLINPHATDETMAGVWQRLRTEGRFTTETVRRRKDGTEFEVELVSSYVQFGGEEFNCAFVRDISTRKADEERLRSQLAELQRWQKVMLDREARVQELKREVNELCAQLGRLPRFNAPDSTAVAAAAGSPRDGGGP